MKISNEKHNELTSFLNDKFNSNHYPTFYQLEDDLKVQFKEELNRTDLIEVCRTLFLQSKYNHTFWSTLLTPKEHPVEAKSIIEAEVKIAQNVDAYTIDIIDGEKVIATIPNMAGQPDTKYSGSAIFGKNYILDLCRYALKNGIIEGDDMLSLSYSAPELTDTKSATE